MLFLQHSRITLPFHGPDIVVEIITKKCSSQVVINTRPRARHVFELQLRAFLDILPGSQLMTWKVRYQVMFCIKKTVSGCQ